MDALPLLVRHELPDCPAALHVSRNGEVVLLSGHDGNTLVLRSEDLEVSGQFELPGGHVYSATLDPTGSCMALVQRERIVVATPQGKVLSERSWPSGPHTPDGCAFSLDGERLWVVGKPGLEVLDWKQNRVVATHPLLFARGCSFLLELHPEGEVVAIGASGGPGHLHLYWGGCHDDQYTVYQTGVEDTISVHFHPSGTEFLTVLEAGTLLRCQFPDGQILGELSDTDVFPEDEEGFVEDEFGLNPCYLSEQLAVLSTNETRLLLVHLKPMQVLGELSIGFPSVLVYEFERVGNRLIATALQTGKGTDRRFLGVWDLHGLTGPMTGPDPSHPFTAALLRQGIPLS